MTENPQASDQFVQSLSRGLAVIRAFDAENTEMTLADVARRTGLTRATARRFLLTLVQLGYVRTDGRLFTLTAQVLQLGYSFLSGLTLPQIAEPHLEALSQEVKESTSASILDGQDIVYVARVPYRRIMTVGINIGTRFPAYATSMGRVLLAGLGEAELNAYLAGLELRKLTPGTVDSVDALLAEIATVREQGWALVNQELEAGLRSVAAPLLGRNGRVVAAVNVSMPVPQSEPGTELDFVLPRLLQTARSISSDLAALSPRSSLEASL